LPVSGDVDYRTDNNAFNGLKGPGIFRPCGSIDYDAKDNICSPIDKIPRNEIKLRDKILADDKVATN
jgi:hypothetical protein